jgi:hypothetical protein
MCSLTEINLILENREVIKMTTEKKPVKKPIKKPGAKKGTAKPRNPFVKPKTKAK